MKAQLVMNAEHESRIRHLRVYVVGALAAALTLELIARRLSFLAIPKLIPESLSLTALLLLAASALYLIFYLQELRGLKLMMSLAVVFLLSSQILNIFDSLPLFNAWPLLGASSPVHNPVKNVIMLIGIIVMLATLYLALLETVAIQGRLLNQRAGLSLEVREREKAEDKLNQSNEQIRRLSAHLVSAREEERTTIAREIHDELGQVLTSLRIDLVGLEQRIRKLQPEDAALTVSQQIRPMTDLIGETMQGVRKLITELRPGILDDLGLCAAIEWQVGESEKKLGIPCAVCIEPETIPIGREQTIALFRILQEALTNVARHAEANSVEVKLFTNGEFVTLEVMDDGKGIADLRAAERSSFGLLGIRERVLQFHGECEIHSAAGQGTRIVVTLPSGTLSNA